MDKNKTIKTEKRQDRGRPRIMVDLEILKNLASIGCPTYEIASVMKDCIDATGVKINWDIQTAGIDIMEEEGTPLPDQDRSNRSPPPPAHA